MKLREFLTVFEQSDRLRIVKNEKDVYTEIGRASCRERV